MKQDLNKLNMYPTPLTSPLLTSPPPPPPPPLPREITESKKPVPPPTQIICEGLLPPMNKIPEGEIREDVPRKFVFNKHIVDILKLTIAIVLAYKCLDLIEIFICKMILW